MLNIEYLIKYTPKTHWFDEHESHFSDSILSFLTILALASNPTRC